jgi:hypothetical protein
VEFLAEGFSRNLAGRDGGLYHGKFQEPFPRIVHGAFQSDRIQERRPPAEFLLALVADIGGLATALYGRFGGTFYRPIRAYRIFPQFASRWAR